MAAPPEANEPRPDRRAGTESVPAAPARAGRAAARGELAVLPGTPFPLGATWDGIGTNFSLFSEVARRASSCASSTTAGHETRIPIREVTAFVQHGYLPGVGPGQRYGFRVHGPWAPQQRPALQPAQAAARSVRQGHRRRRCSWDQPVFPYRFGDENRASTSDSAPFMPKSVVVNPYFDWGNDRRPRTPWHETVIYEAHVKGFTQRHPDVRRDLRGTYAGLAHPASSTTCSGLGVTAVELMPVHQFVHDHRLVEQGLRNYWGYNSIGYFAPHNEYARERRARPAGAGVQADGARRCTTPASRSSSTSSTTTPPRATTSARCCRSRASTTRRTTG